MWRWWCLSLSVNDKSLSITRKRRRGEKNCFGSEWVSERDGRKKCLSLFRKRFQEILEPWYRGKRRRRRRKGKFMSEGDRASLCFNRFLPFFSRLWCIHSPSLMPLATSAEWWRRLVSPSSPSILLMTPSSLVVVVYRRMRRSTVISHSWFSSWYSTMGITCIWSVSILSACFTSCTCCRIPSSLFIVRCTSLFSFSLEEERVLKVDVWIVMSSPIWVFCQTSSLWCNIRPEFINCCWRKYSRFTRGWRRRRSLLPLRHFLLLHLTPSVKASFIRHDVSVTSFPVFHSFFIVIAFIGIPFFTIARMKKGEEGRDVLFLSVWKFA